VAAVLCFAPLCVGQTVKTTTYFGFDRNDYPGDALLPALRRSFAYTGYWLNTPPGDSANTWTGKRAILKSSGFGFMVLYNGRLDAQLTGKDAAALGRSDALDAISAAKREGFLPGAILFLDQEEGGRLLPEQGAYLSAWIETIRKSQYKPGVYCSGIPVPEGPGKITTAEQILNHEVGKPVTLWVWNETFPAAPGCVLPEKALAVASSGIKQALVWQYAKSPRTEFAGRGAVGYAADGSCYAPGIPHSAQTFVDLNVSESQDPSRGR